MWIGKFQIRKKYLQVSHYKMSTLVLGAVVQLVEFLPLFQEALVQSPVLHNLGMVVKASNLSTWDVEAGRSEVQGQPYLQAEFGV